MVHLFSFLQRMSPRLSSSDHDFRIFNGISSYQFIKKIIKKKFFMLNLANFNVSKMTRDTYLF